LIFRSSRQLFGKPLPQIFLLLQHPKGKGGSIYVFDVRLYRTFWITGANGISDLFFPQYSLRGAQPDSSLAAAEA